MTKKHNAPFLLIAFFSIITITSCNTNQVGTAHPGFVKTDYGAADLLSIMSVGNDSETLFSWKVSPDELDTQKKLSLQELFYNFDFSGNLSNAYDFLNTHYNSMWKDKLSFVSMEYVTIDDEKFGSDLNVQRNDWVVIFNFRAKDVNRNSISEKVFMLPDGRIIISSTNFENVKW